MEWARSFFLVALLLSGAVPPSLKAAGGSGALSAADAQPFQGGNQFGGNAFPVRCAPPLPRALGNTRTLSWLFGFDDATGDGAASPRPPPLRARERARACSLCLARWDPRALRVRSA